MSLELYEDGNIFGPTQSVLHGHVLEDSGNDDHEEGLEEKFEFQRLSPYMEIEDMA